MTDTKGPANGESAKDGEIDTRLVRKLADILKATDLTEIEVESGGFKVRVARQGTMMAAPAPVYAQVPASAPAAAPVAAAAGAAPAAAPTRGDAVKSPMVGTAYLSPEPGKPAFINVGDKVAAGQTLLIIEAMKTFNPIKAPKPGTVSKIIIGNAQPVEFGQVLLIVD